MMCQQLVQHAVGGIASVTCNSTRSHGSSSSSSMSCVEQEIYPRVSAAGAARSRGHRQRQLQQQKNSHGRSSQAPVRMTQLTVSSWHMTL
jgi:hypothetical protein